MTQKFRGSNASNGTLGEMASVIWALISFICITGLSPHIDHTIVAAVVSITPPSAANLRHRLTRAYLAATVTFFVKIVITIATWHFPCSTLIKELFVSLRLFLALGGSLAHDGTMIVSHDFGSLNELKIRLFFLWGWNDNGCAGSFLYDDLLGFLADDDWLRRVRTRKVLGRSGIALQLVRLAAGCQPINVPFIAIFSKATRRFWFSFTFNTLDANVPLDPAFWLWLRSSFTADDASLFEGAIFASISLGESFTFTFTLTVW